MRRASLKAIKGDKDAAAASSASKNYNEDDAVGAGNESIALDVMATATSEGQKQQYQPESVLVATGIKRTSSTLGVDMKSDLIGVDARRASGFGRFTPPKSNPVTQHDGGFTYQIRQYGGRVFAASFLFAALVGCVILYGGDRNQLSQNGPELTPLAARFLKDEYETEEESSICDNFHLASSICDQHEECVFQEGKCLRRSLNEDGSSSRILRRRKRTAPTVPTVTAARTNAPSTPFPTSAKASTSAPVTNAPVTATPTTKSPVTVGPTNAPVTATPTTKSPVTNSPVTATPTTKSPVTNAPVTATPTTKSPVTVGPTNAPVTATPTTKSPVTNAPVTAVAPVTSSPTTKSPTTKGPTMSPTTRSPTTKGPTNSPTTRSPTTKGPTKSPTTRSPTTKAPTPIEQASQPGFSIQFIPSKVVKMDAQGVIELGPDGKPVYQDPPAQFLELFSLVKTKLESIIVGDIPATYVYPANATCYGESFTKFPSPMVVEDVLVFISLNENYTGFASAGPCKSTASAPFYNPVGLMNINVKALYDMTIYQRNAESMRSGQSLMLHEILHVLGIGTDWSRKMLVSPPTSPLYYNGTEGAAKYREIAQTTDQSKMPEIEQDFGAGTAFAHFDECIYKSELMTGILDSTTSFSKMSCGVLQDLGYIVDFTKCDPYVIPTFTGCTTDGWPKRRVLRGHTPHNMIEKNVVIVHGDVIQTPPEIVHADPYVNGKPVQYDFLNKKNKKNL